MLDLSSISALNLLCKGKNGRVRGQTAEGDCLHRILPVLSTQNSLNLLTAYDACAAGCRGRKKNSSTNPPI